MKASVTQNFTQPLLDWFEKNGRKNLPWQTPRNAYRVWVSEIMLQQTQVKTVIPYFTRFIARFPDIHSLSIASEDEVLAHWSGLGYYSRGRNLHKTAMIINNNFQGNFPDNLEELIKLPGIGESTGAAIASLAFNKSTAILDGNVKRVLSRYFMVDGLPGIASVKQQLWQLANECMPKDNCAKYTQAIMDLGATCCTNKNYNCTQCPLKFTCLAYKNDTVADYPFKKLKKIIPTKQQQFLLLHTQENLIYLEKNPPVGLWGSLWCLPSIDSTLCPISHIKTTYGLHPQSMHELMAIKHSFSHFHLHIKALSFQMILAKNAVAEYSGRWFIPEEINNLGLAKPVSRIIYHFLKNK